MPGPRPSTSPTRTAAATAPPRCCCCGACADGCGAAIGERQAQPEGAPALAVLPVLAVFVVLAVLAAPPPHPRTRHTSPGPPSPLAPSHTAAADAAVQGGWRPGGCASASAASSAASAAAHRSFAALPSPEACRFAASSSSTSVMDLLRCGSGGPQAVCALGTSPLVRLSDEEELLGTELAAVGISCRASANSPCKRLG